MEPFAKDHLCRISCIDIAMREIKPPKLSTQFFLAIQYRSQFHKSFSLEVDLTYCTASCQTSRLQGRLSTYLIFFQSQTFAPFCIGCNRVIEFPYILTDSIQLISIHTNKHYVYQPHEKYVSVVLGIFGRSKIFVIELLSDF